MMSVYLMSNVVVVETTPDYKTTVAAFRQTSSRSMAILLESGLKTDVAHIPPSTTDAAHSSADPIRAHSVYPNQSDATLALVVQCVGGRLKRSLFPTFDI